VSRSATNGWVLVTDGGTGATRDRDSVAAARGLGQAGYQVAVTVSGTIGMASRSKYCARKVEVPPASDPRYVNSVRAEVSGGEYIATFPTSEPALLALGVARQDLTDKVGLAEAAAKAGLEVPPMKVFPSLTAAFESAGELEFPVVVKPAVRRFYAFKADSPVDLRADGRDDIPVVIQPFINGEQKSISGVIFGGDLVGAVHERWLRIYPNPCGLVCASITVDPDRKLEERIIELLDDYEGLFSVQLIGGKLLDVNLRIHASHPLAVRAGVNLAGIYCDLLRGGRVTPTRARTGFRFRWLEGDLRSIGTDVKQRRLGLAKAVASVLPHRKTSHNPEALNDLGPMMTRASYAVKRLGKRSPPSAC
jgi:predicted ATP-grasp superfamily ATP-dependent carboligase